MKGVTQLLRQVNPAFVQAERITSQVFRPSPKDNDLLSVYDGDLIAPEKAHSHFIALPSCKSIGVLAVTCDECKAEGLKARPDPTPFPEHAVIDFSGLSNNQCEKKGKKLCAYATTRGWLFKPV